MKQLLFFIFLLVLTENVHGTEISVPEKVSQGRAFLVSVCDTSSFHASILWKGESVALKGTPVKGIRNQWKAEALLAMPVDATGRHRLSLSVHGEEKTYDVEAISVPWPKSILTVAPVYAEPPAKVKEQILRDSRRSKEALSLRSEKRWELPLQRPVPGGVTSAFGSRRVFNGKPHAPHKGTDMRCAEGSSVRSVAEGTVVLAEKQYFGGNTVYIDHGQGVFSTYSHLSAFDVSAGQRVRKGQVIGKSGSTGRVTGPHLHFGFIVQGIAADAVPMFKTPLKSLGGPSPTLTSPTQPTQKKRSHP